MIATNGWERSTTPRVALLHSSAGTAYGGSESYVISTARSLSRQVDLRLIVGSGRFTRDFSTLVSSCPIKWLGFPFISRTTLFSSILKETPLHQKINPFDVEAMGALFSLWRINEFIEDTDLLEVNYPTESLLFPFLRKSTKKIIRFHGPWLPPLFAHLWNTIQKHTDACVTCSIWSKAELERKLDSTDITVIHNGVDAASFSPRQSSMSWPVRYDPSLPKVGTAARLSRAKGIDVLFRAARALRGVAEFFVAGPVEKDFENELNDYGSHPNFHLLGPLPNQQMPDFYNSLDCFVLPSRFETFPVSVLEVMACGKPVIASRVGGIPEIIDHGVNGLLVAPHNAGALQEALQRLLQDAALRTALGRAGRDRVLKNFTLEKKADETRAFFEALITRTKNK